MTTSGDATAAGAERVAPAQSDEHPAALAPSPRRFSRADGMEVAGGCAVLLEFGLLLWFVLLWFGR